MKKSRAKIAIIKIVIGYALLAIVLLSATWMAYDNTRSLSGINQANEQLMARRDLVDSLVTSLFETANAERSVLLGDVDQWQKFDKSLGRSKDKLRRLRPFIADSLKRCRIDSLALLLDAKRQNTLLVLAEMGKDQRDIYYNNKVEALQSGRDSVVIHPKTSGRHEQHETVYEIVKSRRGFFRRLGDAFRRQHADTIGVTQIARQHSTDTINHRLNIADNVANALAQIRNEQQRIFNAFTRLPGAQGKEGVGLGLSITREIVQLLDGNIRVSSKKGSGTKFTVTIPVETVKENVEIKACNDAKQAADAPSSASVSVLVIDDDKLQIQLLREMLARIGGLRLDVAATTRADEAMLLAQKLKPQLVFTDIEMPEINGSEMMRRLRGNADSKARSMKFVAMTAHEPSIMPQLRKEGFDACLFKPFSMQTLAATISQTMGILVKPDLPPVIMQFADGDPEAAAQIAYSIRSSVAEYLELLADTSNTEHVSRAAHKAMPLLEMLQPGNNQWLAPLTPEHIGTTDKQEIATLTQQLAHTLKDILRSLQV
ncbi:response regulator [uncultured Prevotella sp.]|uniref:response regulator n=1 Tax=uncultured Prevotella sp. TaxID=159272 RepID=UPI0025F22068|nr:response regulator [uncultured Prevotella sp.]